MHVWHIVMLYKKIRLSVYSRTQRDMMCVIKCVNLPFSLDISRQSDTFEHVSSR